MQEGSRHGRQTPVPHETYLQDAQDDEPDISPEGWTNVLAAWMDATGLSDTGLDMLQPPPPPPPRPEYGVRCLACLPVLTYTSPVATAVQLCGTLLSQRTWTAQQRLCAAGKAPSADAALLRGVCQRPEGSWQWRAPHGAQRQLAVGLQCQQQVRTMPQGCVA